MPQDFSVPNHLINEVSPYLLQHAYNPVDWYPWGEEAFTRAQAEDKPVFLSIGYSTCHWCHVMERESFEDQEVAAALNEGFVAVKVDREERPDLDHVYMTFCQALTGSGGWPLTVILTPDKVPAFAGTYFPKRGRYGRPGLLDILAWIRDKWAKDRPAVLKAGGRVFEQVAGQFDPARRGEVGLDLLEEGYDHLAGIFDPEHGGFGRAPKFPAPHQLLFLLRYWKHHWRRGAGESAGGGAQAAGPADPLAMVEKTLQAMFRGGIYDHVGYGFARYSTDPRWLVPHFEKMLYDNALLAIAYLEAKLATGNRAYGRVAEQVFEYVLRDMTDSAGGFYSAEDADSEGVEGKFYLWTPDEVEAVLGSEEGELFCRTYDIDGRGNFEGRSIPNLIGRTPEVFLDEGWSRLEAARQRLFATREKRVHPHKDDKILTAWNGLMIAALAKGVQVLGKAEYAAAAAKAARFILGRLRDDRGRLLARYRDGQAAFPAYLDDYAFLAWGLVELYQATFRPDYLEEALRLTREMKELFWDGERGGFFFTGRDAEQILARPKEVYDGAMPSGNSVAALNLLRLARLTGDPDLDELAGRQLQAFAGTVAPQPAAYAFFLSAVDFALHPSLEVVVAGEPEAGDTAAILDVLRKAYLPEAVVVLRPEGEEGERVASLAPYTADQGPVDGRTAAYVCSNFACDMPVTGPEALAERLRTL